MILIPVLLALVGGILIGGVIGWRMNPNQRDWRDYDPTQDAGA